MQWLRKHQYITHDYSLEKLYTRGRQDSGRAAAAARRQREQRALSVEAQMEAIERGFEAAKSTPVHATNPSLVAQEVRDVMWGDERCSLCWGGILAGAAHRS